MKKIKLLALCSILTIFITGAATASEHHSGHSGGPKGSSSSGGCGKPQFGKFTPAHLSTVKPESEISFRVFNIDKPDQIFVTIKNIPIELTTEFKDPYYAVKGKIPAELVNTAARINIKVKAKSPHCEAEDGWLITVSDK